MDLIQQYASDSDVEPTINLAPTIDITYLQEKKENDRIKSLNKLYTDEKPSKNHLTGQADIHFMDNFTFDEQYNNFNTLGFAYDPSSIENRVVFNEYLHPEISHFVKKGANVSMGKDLLTKSVYGLENKKDVEEKKLIAKKRKRNWDPTSNNFKGPWASYDYEENYLNPEQYEKQQQYLSQKAEEKQKLKQEEKEKREKERQEIQSEFHGKDLVDYQGRSYLMPPKDLKYSEHTCYIPKKCIQVYSGHTKGVQKIRFFPKYGHFILSASIDTKIKLWDVNKTKTCTRTYMGHKEAVKDIYFTHDGLHFLSAGFDKSILYWDTEMGKVVKTFHLRKFPFCVRFNPDADKQHSFLVGSSNKKIGQYDLRSGNRTQVYDEHLGAVNTLTFIDNNRKFVSTSDDKKVFIWEFGIPVVVKHISEPEMHAISQTALHPSNKYFAGQSSDNKILIYDAKAGNFRLNRKKKFDGHMCAGYAVGITFSTDGQFLCSGDADGKIWFWDWKTTKNYRCIEAHETVCIDVAWHPIEPSKIATASWDGTIKLWD